VSLAFLLQVSGIADDVRGIDWIHLADDHPGEEHAPCGQPLLDGGPGTGLRLALDEGSDVCRPQLGEEGRELAHRLEVSAVDIAVADGSEKLRDKTATIIPFETAETQANLVDTGPKS
jgi:hypothetical protein